MNDAGLITYWFLRKEGRPAIDAYWHAWRSHHNWILAND